MPLSLRSAQEERKCKGNKFPSFGLHVHPLLLAKPIKNINTMASNEPESTDDRLVPLIRKFLVIGCAIGVSYQAIFSLKAVHRLPHVEREGLTFVSAQKPFTHNTERRRHLSADSLTHEFLQSEKGASIIPSLRKFAVDNRQPIKRIFLLGERSSETFALNEALVAAFPGYGEGKNKFYSNIPVLQHKHMVGLILLSICCSSFHYS